ncbi:heavy-metal-associated domain-containing protein [Sporosarcina ureilytica]|uniref:Heavy metal-binding protein n=1 Tax=Sporosarcina ureilytica TaxID=298596 RepID=A0A1D8JD05_9BACL|nr:heavy-metal-associated domain-containing protein [Sporosarcina ureilytica]AOV06584.1 heavy metal-binding protein [Sporosarcina ureilytica]
MKKAVFNLEPLGCPTCVKKIQSTLEKMEGVEEVKVLFHSNRVRTQFDENKVQAEDIQNTITKLGYPVLSQKVS